MMHEPTRVTSSKNPRLKQLAKLQTRRGRKQTGLTIVYGRREIARAWAGGIVFEQLLMSEDCAGREDTSWLEQLRGGGTELVTLPADLLASFSFGDRHDGCLAVVRMPDTNLEGLKLPPVPCVAIVERVEKPGNLGAILRSADGAGISAVVVADPVTDLMNPNVIRASMGTVFTVPNCVATHEQLTAWIRRLKLQVVATRVDAEQLYYDVDLTLPTAIVLGSEADGLDETWKQIGESSVRLPMFGVADSLNVSATAAVMFYEVLRQRHIDAR